MFGTPVLRCLWGRLYVLLMWNICTFGAPVLRCLWGVICASDVKHILVWGPFTAVSVGGLYVPLMWNICVFCGQNTNRKHLKTFLRTVLAPRREQFRRVCNGQFSDLHSPLLLLELWNLGGCKWLNNDYVGVKQKCQIFGKTFCNVTTGSLKVI